MCVCVCARAHTMLLQFVRLFAALWTVACQIPLSKGFSRILGWVTMPSSRGIFPTQGSNPHLLCLLHLVSKFFTTSATWEAREYGTNVSGKFILLQCRGQIRIAQTRLEGFVIMKVKDDDTQGYPDSWEWETAKNGGDPIALKMLITASASSCIMMYSTRPLRAGLWI